MLALGGRTKEEALPGVPEVRGFPQRGLLSVPQEQARR